MPGGGQFDDHYDVGILGGGLAGLSLAIQLKRDRPETSVLVLEKRPGEAPEATFKVGESTLDLGAWYYGEVVGMRDHIEQEQLPKFGLRFFFPADGNRDIARRIEWGPPFWSPISSCQLDRGRFENELADRARAAGVELAKGWRVQDVTLGEEHHHITSTREDEEATVAVRWLVDAGGRASILKRKFGLGEDTDHHINSAWFRLRGEVDVEDWSDDQAWLDRMPERGLRRLSTSHLMGPGYWVWLIPLASGSTSVGIVADPRQHPFEEFGTLEAALDWFARHEPQVHAAVSPRRDDVQDFLTVQDFSLGCTQVYSRDRWCLTGEAGAFLDPLFSPGSDFIAFSNLLIGDMIGRSLDGEDVGDRAEAQSEFFLDFVDHWFSLYVDQYEIFGNPLVVCAKLLYNTANGYSLLPLFFERRIADVPFEPALKAPLDQLLALTDRVEPMFREWHRLTPAEYEDAFVYPVTFAPFIQLAIFLAQHRDPASPRLSLDALAGRMRQNVAMLEGVAVVLFHNAAAGLPGGPPDPDRKVNPYAISLEPDRWEPDGLFASDGLTLAEAREQAAGVEDVLKLVTGELEWPLVPSRSE